MGNASGYVGSFGTIPGGGYFQNRPLYWNIINQPANIDFKTYRNWQTDPFANPNGYFNAYYGNPWWQIDQSRFKENQSDILGTLIPRPETNQLAGIELSGQHCEG